MSHKPNRTTILLPPLFRLLGSENRRVTPGVVLDNAQMIEAGYTTTIVHADAADVPLRRLNWLELLERSVELRTDRLSAKLNDLWPELQKRLLRSDPDQVVVCCNDWVEPAKDLADRSVCLELGDWLARAGLRAIAIGGLCTLFPNHFANHYNAVITGIPGEALPNTLRGQDGVVKGLGLEPYLRIPATLPSSDVQVTYDQVATEFGCRYGKCSYCPLARIFAKGVRHRCLDRVVEDIALRPDRHIHIIDTCFGGNLQRLQEITSALGGLNKSYTVTTRLDIALRKDVRRYLRELDVRCIKLGIETLDQKEQAELNKDSLTPKQIEAGLRLLHREGFELCGYLLLRSEQSARSTLAKARELPFVTWIPNVFCPLGDPSPAAHHFSMPQARRLGIREDTVRDLFTLSLDSAAQEARRNIAS